ncbi:unnamed protein product [Nippostrongylus brasiliensis]|uniref:Serpentine receptor class gamma n=1 Tax=Nippostrongylus brasiliensis TaxID=27835 RepID=A0A0N4XTB3_NIPBR|nr:unnamed protein product [Nippostrongylus brasiliensis]
MEISISDLLALYTSNLLWSLFLTSTAVHAVALITSPMQAVLKWYRRQSSDSDTSLPYLCAVVGLDFIQIVLMYFVVQSFSISNRKRINIRSGLWLRYSIFIQDTKLILLQSYAVAMQSFFVFALIFYRSKKRRLIRAVILIATATGRIASAAQITGSLVCPYLIYKAITSRCVDFVPLAPVAFTWIMELHAIIYSIGIDDFYMLLANTIFFCMDGSLLAMFFVFPNEKPLHYSKVETS